MIRSIVIISLSVISTMAYAAETTWPQWRGPNRDGQVTGPAWPDKLKDDSLKTTWKVENLGPSYSGPIVYGDYVITTQTKDKKEELVQAYDRKSGKQLWEQKWEGSTSVPFFAAKNGSWIRSTPATDGKTVYVGGIRDLIVALDIKTGKELWRYDCMKELKSPVPDFGCVCSPMLDETGVYIQAGGCFIKLDKTTGKLIWHTLKDGGGMMGSAFSSPISAKLAGKDQIVVQTRTKLAGIDRETGKELWVKEIPSFRGMNILTPISLGDDGVFTSTYGGNTRLVKIKPDTSEKFAISDDWSLKYEGNMTTPVVVEGHAYILGKDRRLLCVDVATGKEAWRTEGRFGEYWSMVANKDKILALDQTGTLYLLKANAKEYTLLDSRKVANAESWAHLAIVGDELFIRDLNTLTAWKWK